MINSTSPIQKDDGNFEASIQDFSKWKGRQIIYYKDKEGHINARRRTYFEYFTSLFHKTEQTELSKLFIAKILNSIKSNSSLKTSDGKSTLKQLILDTFKKCDLSGVKHLDQYQKNNFSTQIENTIRKDEIINNFNEKKIIQDSEICFLLENYEGEVQCHQNLKNTIDTRMDEINQKIDNWILLTPEEVKIRKLSEKKDINNEEVNSPKNIMATYEDLFYQAFYKEGSRYEKDDTLIGQADYVKYVECRQKIFLALTAKNDWEKLIDQKNPRFKNLMNKVVEAMADKVAPFNSSMQRVYNGTKLTDDEIKILKILGETEKIASGLTLFSKLAINVLPKIQKLK